MASKLVNLALYEAGWFACVLGAAHGHASWGAVLALLLVGVHLALVDRPRQELRLILAAGLLGLVLDTLQFHLGVLTYPAPPTIPGIAPLWILVLWLQFATLFHFALNWLSQRYLLSAVIGFLGGPLSFLAGERLGAATLSRPYSFSLASLALVWALAIPTLVWLTDRQVEREGRTRYRFS